MAPRLSGFLSRPVASLASLGEACPRARPGKTTARNFGPVGVSVKKGKRVLKFGSGLAAAGSDFGVGVGGGS